MQQKDNARNIYKVSVKLGKHNDILFVTFVTIFDLILSVITSYVIHKKTLTSTAQLLHALCWKKPRPPRYWLGENIETVSRPNFSPR